MLNHPSRNSEENAEAPLSLLRPLAIFFTIALLLAATVSQPVDAASRDRSLRHARPAHVLMHSYAVTHASSRRARARTASSRRSAAHEIRERAPRSRAHRRNAVVERSARRRHGARSVVIRDVAMSRPAAEPMARPVPGVNAIVEAAPGSVTAAAKMEGTNVPANPISATELAEGAVQPHVFPMYTRTGRLIVPAPLRGSREILVHQNEMADAAGLERIQNDEDLERLRYQHQLVEVADTTALHVNPELPENRRFARPWTAKFAGDIARAYYARFGEPLELNSAVRTISYQLRLQHVNGNAAAIAGDTASPHLTGQAIDFGKRGMTTAEIAWMRLYLTPLMNAGLIDVEEEFQQACFHISVYRKYTGGSTADLAQAQLRSRAGDAN